MENLPQEYLPEDKKREIEVELRDIEAKAATVAVTDQASMDQANNWLTWINDRQKGIESFRLAIVKPIKDHIKKIDEYFKWLSGRYEQPKEKITGEVLRYREKLAESARKERERLEREAAEKEAKIKAALEAEAKKAKSKAEAERLRKLAEETVILAKEPKKEEATKTSHHDMGGVTYVKDADYEISDAAKIPDEFWCIDKVKIGARVRELKKDMSVGKIYKDLIPGVTIKCIERPSITRMV